MMTTTPLDLKTQPEQKVNIWSGFYKKALKERQNQLKLAFPNLFPPTSPIISRSSFLHSPSSGSVPNLTKSASDVSIHRNESSSDISSLGIPEEKFPITSLDERIADNMIENCVGTLGLPVGVALNFNIDGKPVIVPMAIEEPSVVAAVSGAAKTVSQFGKGKTFYTTTSERNITFAQVVILDVPDNLLDENEKKLNSMKNEIITYANQYCQNMYSRGGGVVNMVVRRIKKNERKLRPNQVVFNSPSSEWLVCHFHIDVCDAMGANCASTVAEGVAPFLAELTNGRIGLRIVSNLCTERIVTASFKIPVEKMKYKKFTGEQVARGMIEAYELAEDDVYRATTHNKGILNGIDAVALATGQDWRAIEAAAHAFAASGSSETENEPVRGHYKSLTSYWVEEVEENVDGANVKQRYFCGEIKMPIAVGTKGGVLKTNPVYHYTLGLMGHPDSKALSAIFACVGLAQNFAAVRALTTEGIQRGHMSLHARNIAIAAGAPSHAIAEVTDYMVACNRINLNAAKEYLLAHELHSTLRKHLEGTDSQSSKPPSMFYFEEYVPEGEDKNNRVTLNIAFQTLTNQPTNIEYPTGSNDDPISQLLFGNKDYTWISSMLNILDKFQFNTASPGRANFVLAKKLKFLSMIINIITTRLMTYYPKQTTRFIERIFRHTKRPKSTSSSLKTKAQQPSIEKYLISVQAYANQQLQNQNIHLPGPISAHSVPSSSGLSWSVPDTGIFRKNILDIADDVKNLSDPTLIQVGFPLLLALWQVFELRVVQWVGHSSLSSSLLEEQRKVISAIVSSPIPPYKPSEVRPPVVINGKAQDTPYLNAFNRFIPIYAKRFQVTMILLCNAISFDPTLINSRRIKFLLTLGSYLEWELAKDHDLGRLGRDLMLIQNQNQKLSHDGSIGNGITNSFIIWKEMREKTNPKQNMFHFEDDDDTDDSISSPSIVNTIESVDNEPFYQRYQEEIKQYLLETDHSIIKSHLFNTETCLLFSKEMLETTIEEYQKYYNVKNLLDSLNY
ncbi:hypothetical protein LY90DRAFT_524166 [Neocallimastix californiae]|jgi:degradative hydroxymethylglutaryl-CoA reductase|uniref:3-hydroxy-3-methylglutaryl coenzyme A reductase n=1 Tax=Neocallimastix californiae TaxID=1754190 RepID=A0A1Y2B005_9FUNG|nr:hypothetical protein LY90DRAFT_524166 [Neocallimastix californiae]|eukprot:ORY28066.1 hypothetical protein LY90DRAFT_524166 [Neocallimastix californiae]